MTVSQSLGEAYDPLGAHLQDPYPFYARARQEEPVFFSEAVNAWVVTRYEDVRGVLRHPEAFSSANVLRPAAPFPAATAAVLREGYPPDLAGLQMSDGAAHRRLRSPVAHGLSAARVAAVEPFVRQRSEELVDGIAGDGRADLMERYAYPLPISVIAHLCGLAPADAETAFTGSYQATHVLHSQRPEPERTAAARDLVRLHQMCGRYVHARRAEPGDDVISEVVTALAPGDGPLSPEQETEVGRTIVGIVLAGHVTTSRLIGTAVHLLLTHREQWELLCERPELIPNAVEETVRFDPPTHAFPRVTTREVAVGERRLPKGAEVLVVFASANRDPVLCDRPEEFDITRPPTRHMGFGTGPHACVGATVGRRETVVALETLTRRLPALRLVADQDFTVRGSLVIRGLTSLLATW